MTFDDRVWAHMLKIILTRVRVRVWGGVGNRVFDRVTQPVLRGVQDKLNETHL